jgi:translation elongation factor EF-Tu-like GTPase
VQVVQKGELAPGCCVLTGDIDGPFLDTGFVVNQETVGLFPRAYLHVPLVKQMGVAVGMVTHEELNKSNERIRELQDELEQARRDLMEAEAFEAAIHTIEKKGDYKARKKPGRKPQPKEVVG